MVQAFSNRHSAPRTFVAARHCPYGSAASRRPSPRKLKARMTMITGIAGISSQGEIARAWMFCACCSSTPQLMAGGRSPRPRKLQRGLADDHGRDGQRGRGDDVAQERRHHVRKMMRSWPQPASSAAITKSSSRSDRKRPRTTRASSVQPIERDDDRDGEVDLGDAPVVGQGRRQAHPQRDRRDGAQDLDDALDDGVDGRRRRGRRCRPGSTPRTRLRLTPTRPMDERGLRAVHQPRPEVAPLLVGAEEEERLLGRRRPRRRGGGG